MAWRCRILGRSRQIEIDEQTGEEVEKENINYATYKFHTEPIIETKDYRTSYQWDQLKKQIKPYKYKNINFLSLS